MMESCKKSIDFSKIVHAPYERPSYMQLTSALPQLFKSCSTKLHDLKFGLAGSRHAPKFIVKNALHSVWNSESKLVSKCEAGKLSDGAVVRKAYRIATDTARLHQQSQPIRPQLTLMVNGILEVAREMCSTQGATEQLDRLLHHAAVNVRAEDDVRKAHARGQLQDPDLLRDCIKSVAKHAPAPSDFSVPSKERFNRVAERLGLVPAPR